jgi:capsular exopolysaccharide synthesis family protein
METQIIPPGETAPITVSPQPQSMERRGRNLRMPIEQEELPFAEAWRILRKRRALILKVTCVCLALAISYTVIATPKYRSESTIEFNKQNSDSLALDEQRGMLADTSSMDYIVTQQTQVKAMLSDTLALRVIRELNLTSHFEKLSTSVLSTFSDKHLEEAALPLERAPHRRVKLLKYFQKNLKVAPVAGTRLISVQFLDPDSKIAASVVNTLVQDYKDQYFQNRYTATMEASGWLSKQLDDLRVNVESSQQRLVDFQRQAGILGTDESHNIVMTKLQEVDQQLTNAEANRIVAHTVAQLVRNGNPELVSGLINDQTGSALINGAIGTSSTVSPVVLNYLEVLRSQQRDLKMQYAASAAQYGAANPKLGEMKIRLDQIEQSIEQEIKNLTIRAENDDVAAQQNEKALRVAFEDEKEEANKLNDSAVQYTILKHEAESSRTLYDGLLAKFKEAGVLAGLHNSNIVVMDQALESDKPARPILLLNLALGIFVGLMCGVGSAFAAENLDDKINSADDAEAIAMVPVLGVVPSWKNPKGLKISNGSQRALASQSGICVLSFSRSQPAEAFRAIRTSIIHSTRRGESTSIIFTSALSGEGKSTVSLNCAAAFAQQGARVLLVEADMRRPTLKTYLNLNCSTGLSSLIRGEASPELPVKLPSLPTLSIIPAGPPTGYPADLLGSDQMKELVTKWSKQYDYIFFDTPPALSVTDAVVLAPFCNLVVLVARSKVTRKQALHRTCMLFRRLQPRVLGVVVNGFDSDSPDFAAYYGYENDSKSGGGYHTPIPKNV